MTKTRLAGTDIHWKRLEQEPAQEPGQEQGQGQREALLIHCSLAHLGAWRGLAADLSDLLSMLAFDLPGHGQSGDWDPRRDYQDQATEAAIALLDHAATGPVDLIGHSFGATVALRLAQMAPDRVRSLTLIEPVLFAAARHRPEFAEEMAFMSGPFAEAMQAGDRIGAARLFHSVWGGNTPWERLPVILRDEMAARIHLIPAAAGVTAEDSHGQAAPGALERVKRPCLLLEGAKSPPIIAAIHDVFAARLPDARRAVIAEAGHMAPISHPAEVAAEIRKFLDDIPAQTVVSYR